MPYLALRNSFLNSNCLAASFRIMSVRLFESCMNYYLHNFVDLYCNLHFEDLCHSCQLAPYVIVQLSRAFS